MANNVRGLRGERVRVQLVCNDKSLAVQASKDECDINTIVKKYLKTGELPGARKAAYMDLTKVKDLQGSLNDVILAQDAFLALPADVRAAFDNDPVKLIEGASDPKQKDKFIKLGLLDEPRHPAPPSQPASSAGGQPATPPSGSPPSQPASSAGGQPATPPSG